MPEYDNTLYEVTLPVTVKVTVCREGDKIVGIVSRSHLTIDGGWPGFFSEAEEAGGAWNPATQEWEQSEAAQRATAYATTALMQALL